MSGFPKLDPDLPRSFAAHPLLYKSSSHAAASYDKPWLGISEMSHLVDQMATELPKKDGEGMCKARCFIHPVTAVRLTLVRPLRGSKAWKVLDLQEIPVEP